MRTGKLMQAYIERIGWRKGRLRGWLVTGYRIVDEKGRDMVLPYAFTKKEARETAQALGITLIEKDRKNDQDTYLSEQDIN
jgi:hypothetical protein